MGYFDGLPYTNFHELNLDWLLKEVKALGARIDGLKDDILTEANRYTDQKISSIKNDFEALKAEFNRIVADLDEQYDVFIDVVEAQFEFMREEIRAFEAKMAAQETRINERTDIAIQQAIDAFSEKIPEEFEQLTVNNFFTGQLVSIQDMFDYLASLHVQNGLTYDEVTAKRKTYAQMTAYNATYQQITLDSASIIN